MFEKSQNCHSASISLEPCPIHRISKAVGAHIRLVADEGTEVVVAFLVSRMRVIFFSRVFTRMIRLYRHRGNYGSGNESECKVRNDQQLLRR